MTPPANEGRDPRRPDDPDDPDESARAPEEEPDPTESLDGSLGAEDETLPGPAGEGSEGDHTGAVGDAREMETVAGGFTSSLAKQFRPSPDDMETVLESDLHEASPGGSDPGATREDAAAGTAPGKRPRRRPRRVTRGDTRQDATARDDAAFSGSATPVRAGAAPRTGKLAPGDLLAGRYELVSRLGKGGMGEVWKARHTLLQGLRAIKLIKASISRDASFRARFLREGQTMMRVKHPGVVEVTDLDETRVNRELFMVMEHLAGRTLYAACRNKETPVSRDTRDLVRILREVALGMQRIHDERIVHKDLKSDNVILVPGEDGLEHPKVIDFGLAKNVEAEQYVGTDGTPVVVGPGSGTGAYDPAMRTSLSGTLAYMSPEQFRSEPSSFQSDIYAFGVMAYECFTNGSFPLPRGGLDHYLALHEDESVQPSTLRKQCPQVDRFVTDLVDRCMAPVRTDRPESFDYVAKELLWWIQKPERARRRNRILMMTGAAAMLIGIAVWGFFFGRTASLSQLSASFDGEPIPAHRGQVFLPGKLLRGLSLSAPIQGKPGEPRLRVDGRDHPAQTRVEDGRLVASVDFSELDEGVHEIALRASPNGAETSLEIVVDRQTPGFTSLEVLGAAGRFTNAEVPEVAAALDEEVAEVYAVVTRGGDRPRVAGERDDDVPGRWVIRGTHGGDGPVAIEVVAVDRAGNGESRRLEYERDTVDPGVTIADLRREDGRDVVPVRSAVGAQLRVDFEEPGRVTLRCGGSVVERDFDLAGPQVFDLPAVPEAGVEAVLTMTDRAGNVTQPRFVVRPRADAFALTTLEGSGSLAVDRGTAARLRLSRSYAIGGKRKIAAARQRDADGNEVREPPGEFEVVYAAALDEFSYELRVPAGSLADGTWLLTVLDAGEASVSPLTLTVDGRDPFVHSTTVYDARGRVVPPGAWCLTQDVEIEVDVTDLSLVAAQLNGNASPTAAGPGRRTYRFRARCAVERANSFTLALRDAAGKAFEDSVSVNADWTSPQLALEVGSTSGDGVLKNTEPAKISGTCSEAPFTLVLSGPAVSGGESRHVLNTATFSVNQALLPGTHDLRFVAEDPAGRRSEAGSVRVVVRKIETELPPEITWTRGPVEALMEKVEPGDVVIGGKIYAVERAFVDRAEVTNAEYRAFLAAGSGGHGAWCHADEPEGWSHTPPAETWGDPQWSAPELPVVNVAWWDAHAFAGWTGRRLPTEAEWVKAAAKKKGELELLRWPTGNDWVEGRIVTQELVSGQPWQGPAPARAGADESPIGCVHMGGNVSEWVRLDRVPEGERATAVRGGNWFLTRVAADVRKVPAKAYDPGFRADTIGFRCAVDAEKVNP